MRRTDFSKGSAKKKMNRSRSLFQLSVLGNADISLQFKLARRASNRKLEYEKTCLRTRTIASNSFNLNCYSDQDAFHSFSFRVTEIPKISSCMGWHGNPTKRGHYRYDAITACCIVLRKLATPCRWYDLETTFRIHSGKLSEVFLEQVECFMEACGSLQTKFQK